MENKIDKLLLESIDRDIDIILDNQVEIKFSFDLYGLCFHVYKDVWSPLVGKEGLECFHERKTTFTNLRLSCIVMIFLGELLLEMH